MEKTTLNVEGMSCSHCENAIKNALGTLDGVDTVQVDLQAKTVTVTYDAAKVTTASMKAEIEDQGYAVV